MEEMRQRQAAGDGAEPGLWETWYLEYRRYVFAVCYRMLGTAAEAEDAVQDCFLELRRRPLEQVANPKAYLAKMAVNRCLNLLSSARKQREVYRGEWLPEPLNETAGTDGSPGERLELSEELSYACLVMLERLKPAERAVWLLREVFEYEYAEIAEIVDKSESNCRQLFSRARRSLPSGMETMPAVQLSASRRGLLDRFIAAFFAYDVNAMLELLADEPVFTADGGDQVHSVLRPMHGRKGVLALLTSRRVLTKLRGLRPQIAVLNGEAQVVFAGEDGTIHAALCLEIPQDEERLRSFYLVVNPDKLRTLQAAQTDKPDSP